MGTEYIVKAGDYLVKIADENGYESWRDIYYHEDNAAFRKKRPNPNQIYPGDVLILPDKELPVVTVPPIQIPPIDIPPPEVPPGETPPVLEAERRMFNLFWAHPIPSGLGTGIPISFDVQNTLNNPSQGIEAIIVYPALVTPEILVGSDDLELLILVKDQNELTPADVNLQLKFNEGLDRTRPYFDDPLFASDPASRITVLPVPFNEGISSTSKRFAGLTYERVRTLYGDGDFKILFMVTIKSDFLFESRTMAGKFNDDQGGRIVPWEKQDQFINGILGTMNGPNIHEQGKYAFKMGADNVDLTQVDLRDPIQAYHPVFWYKTLGYVNLGHLADLHINARQNILSKTNARVIEFQADIPDGWAELDTAISPPIGPMVSICSRNVKQILDKLGSDSMVDVVVITGDFIDFIMSWYPRDPSVMYNPSIRKIWSEVALDDSYQVRYQGFVDFISFYSLIVNFLDQYRKPIFMVNGNHDCYFQTYGISPRVSAFDVKANAGIAADHNLTIYEAILAFGDTYHEYISPEHMPLTGFFDEEKYLWFYAVFTPFTDFVAHLPCQSILGLGWGGDEDMLDAPLFDQGLGHLPRANDAFTDMQLEFLQMVASLNRRLILISHFTFVNYDNPIPAWTYDEEKGWSHTEGLVKCSDETGYAPNEFGDYDFGTFSKKRLSVFWNTLRQQKVQLTVSGHSHRRGLYGICGWEEDPNALQTRFYEFEFLPDMWNDRSWNPKMVVCDSAGSLPRLNRGGEFDGWGCDYPSGSRILFDKSTGEVAAIQAVPAIHSSTRPRLAVTVDYYNMDTDVFETFCSDPVSSSDECSGLQNAYSFEVKLDSNLMPLIFIRAMRLYLISPETGDQCAMPFEFANDRWWLRDRAARDFYYASQFHERRVFLAVQFGPMGSWIPPHYDCDSWWNSECWIDCSFDGLGGLFSGTSVYRLLHSYRQIDFMTPDLDWRKSTMYKYQGPE